MWPLGELWDRPFFADAQLEAVELLQVASEVAGKVYSTGLSYIWDMGEAFVYEKALKKARDWAHWEQTALTLDSISGAEDWKLREQSNVYDYRLLKRRLRILQNLRKTGETEELVHFLRSGLVRGIGGSLSPALYERCLVGTKSLIVEYQKEVCHCLRQILGSPKYPLKSKISFFSESRYAYGKTALLLSGGAMMGMYHLGVIKALHGQGLLPRVIAGSSAGSLVAAMICTTEWENLGQLFQKGTLNCDPFSGLERGSWARKLKRFFKEGHLLDVRVLKDFVRKNIGDITFSEAYEKTGLVLNITVSESSCYQDYRLLNYLTAPHVLVWSAALASCAIPYVFPAIELLCKDVNGTIVTFYPSGMKFIDGSVKADLPMERLAELFNVNAFIVSQTNPWVIPLLSEDDGGGTWGDSLRFRAYKTVKRLCLMEFRHRLKQLNSLGLSTVLSVFLGVFAQEYCGHVTIWPVPSVKDYLNILSNPTEEIIQRCVRKGMLRTFPKMNMLKSVLSIEKAFDECYFEIRNQLRVDAFKLKEALNEQMKPNEFNDFSSEGSEDEQ